MKKLLRVTSIILIQAVLACDSSGLSFGNNQQENNCCLAPRCSIAQSEFQKFFEPGLTAQIADFNLKDGSLKVLGNIIINPQLSVLAEKGDLTAQSYRRVSGLSINLTRKHFSSLVKAGLLKRDETTYPPKAHKYGITEAGRKFYPNLVDKKTELFAAELLSLKHTGRFSDENIAYSIAMLITVILDLSHEEIAGKTQADLFIQIILDAEGKSLIGHLNDYRALGYSVEPFKKLTENKKTILKQVSIASKGWKKEERELIRMIFQRMERLINVVSRFADEYNLRENALRQRIDVNSLLEQAI